MNIGVLGSGNVGQAIGAGFASLGHAVKMGTRNPSQDKVKAWIEKTKNGVTAGTFAEAAAFAELAVLATNWVGSENAIRLADPKNLVGKVVIDATNPLDFSSGVPPKLTIGHTTSAGEQVQGWLTGSHVVKAFNIVGNADMVNPQFPGGPPDMFICGNDSGAKQIVAGLLKAFGWPVIDLGGIEGSRFLEPLAMIWIFYGFQTNSWNHAFKLLRK